MRRSRPLRTLVLWCAAALALAACGGGGSGTAPEDIVTSGSLDELVTAAQEEGSFVWYSTPTEDLTQAAAEAFTEQYDVDVEFVRLANTDLTARYSSEAEAGAPAADVVTGVFGNFYLEAYREGWFVPLEEAGIPDYPGDYPENLIIDVEGGTTAIASIVQSAIGYNTDLVPAADAPQEWLDLLDPKLKGKVFMTDPRSSDTFIYWHLIAEQVEKSGEMRYDEFLTKLGDQIGRTYPSAIPLSEALGAGEAMVQIPAPPPVIVEAADRGAPVDYHIPSYTAGSQFAVGISRDGASPNAARLFAHWLLYEGGGDMLTGIPPDAPGLKESTFLSARTAEEFETQDRVVSLMFDE